MSHDVVMVALISSDLLIGVTEPLCQINLLFLFFPFHFDAVGGKEMEGMLALTPLIIYAVTLAPHSHVSFRLHVPDVGKGGSTKTGETSDSTPEPPTRAIVEYPSQGNMERSDHSGTIV